MAKARFTYREFYDVPRVIVLHHRSLQLLLDCRFDEAADEYAPSYLVYVLPADLSVDSIQSWDKLYEAALRFVGEIPVDRVIFDVTRRSEIDTDAVDHLLEAERAKPQDAGEGAIDQ
jgi:hypothetical protein